MVVIEPSSILSRNIEQKIQLRRFLSLYKGKHVPLFAFKNSICLVKLNFRAST